MKVACPNCGQHYDVEASALDRYFRCTECKTLFLGLNAKSVKQQKFKRRKKEEQPETFDDTMIAAEDPATEYAAEEALNLVRQDQASPDTAELEDEATENKTVTAVPVEVDWDQVNADIAEEPKSKLDFLAGMDLALWLGICCAVVMVFLVVMLFVCSGRINELRSVQFENQHRVNDLLTKVESLERRVESLSREADRLRENVIDLERRSSRGK